ncbi:FecR domain-containing protein [uncultured Caulobacter sp.]|uniref:FecR family protein n=1 Tax=uncultured Caulobacter sp. TaxID=158749 RepID=UPI00262A0629|nr:FecR domain-containing protein [uncultured Caulobacter sp.]
MSPSTVPSNQARSEASAWFARLNKRAVPAADMEAFQAWRRLPGNRAAYDEVDAFWRRSQAVHGDSDIQAAISSAHARARSKPRRPAGLVAGLGAAFALALVVVGGVAGYRLYGPATYETRVGEQRLVRLSDDSTVMLDTDSKVLVRYDRGHRNLELLEGRAMFEVAHDAARPFVVRAGNTSVTALGTRFDVRRADGGAEVTLVRGSVEVREAKGAAPVVWRLSPGQGLSTAAPTPRPVSVDLPTETSWTTGRLVFNRVPLKAAVAEVNRYDRRKIVLDVGPLDAALISGTFDVGDTDTFVSSVAEMNDFVVQRSGDGPIRLARGPAPPATP